MARTFNTDIAGMSFLVGEEDEQTALQETLAFIDGWEAPTTDPDGSRSEEAASASESAGCNVLVREECSKRQRVRACDLRRRLRKKEERQQLRQQVEELEWRLMQLQSARRQGGRAWCSDSTNGSAALSPTSPLEANAIAALAEEITRGTADRPGQSVWRTTARILRNERMQAEALNLRLRKTLASETKVAKALGSLLNERLPALNVGIDNAELQPSNLLKGLPQPGFRCSPNSLRHEPDAVVRELKATLAQMYLDSSFVFDPAKMQKPSISCSFDVQLDPLLGPVTVGVSTTPLGCDLHHARQFLGTAFLKKKHLELRTPSFNMEAKPSTNAGEKYFKFEVGAPEKSVLFDGVGGMLKYEEEDRVLVIWAALSFHSSGALCLRERGWLIATRSTENPSQESLLRTHYLISSAKAEGIAAIDGEDIDHVRNRALGVLGAHKKKKQQFLQRIMLIESGREDLAAFVDD